MGDINSCCDSRTIENQIGQKIIYSSLSQLVPETKITLPFISPAIQDLLNRGKQSIFYRKDQKQQSSREKVIKLLEKDQTVIYQGKISDDKANGKGKLYFKNGSVFEGTFEDGQPVNGVFALSQKRIYVGDIVNYEACGKGSYMNLQTGYSYEGQWSKNMSHGEGKEIFPNGDIFRGLYMFGSKFGQGDYTFKNGNRYVGSFYNGHSDGIGKIICANGEVYEGDWKLGKMSGKGVFKWPNGETYVGQYLNGVKHGKGKYKFSNGSYYEGEWNNGVQDGEGLIRQGYDTVKGTWKNGQKI